MHAELVIFDCDGVLVDTEAMANECMAKVFTEIGFATTGRECRKLFQGKTIEDVCSEVAILTNRPYDPTLAGIVRTRVEETLAMGVEPVPGVIEVEHSVVPNKLPYCVASSGSVQKMQLTLGSVGLLPLVQDCLFSAQDVGRGKPHPDVFIAL